MNELDCVRCEALLDDALDDRLAPENREAVLAHLSGCDRCRVIDEQLRWVRTSLRAIGASSHDVVSTERLGAILATELHSPPSNRSRAEMPSALDRNRRGITRRRFVAAALAAGLAGLLLLARKARPTRAARLASLKSELDEHSTTAGPGDFERLDAKALEAKFASAGLSFPARVIDLSMMEIRVVGGSTRSFFGRPATLVLYETVDGPMLCRMVLDDSQPSIAPTGRSALRERGFEFVTTRWEGVSYVIWREGRVVCLLVARMSEDALLALARAKAMV